MTSLAEVILIKLANGSFVREWLTEMEASA
jgi:hypothetical protein